jgi:hypothetical protein
MLQRRESKRKTMGFLAPSTALDVFSYKIFSRPFARNSHTECDRIAVGAQCAARGEKTFPVIRDRKKTKSIKSRNFSVSWHANLVFIISQKRARKEKKKKRKNNTKRARGTL